MTTPFVHSARYEVDIGVHVFPTEKYRLLRERLLARGLATAADFAEPQMPSWQDLLRVHTPEYLDDLFNMRSTWRTSFSELPLTKEIVEAFTLAAGGTTLAARSAIEAGAALHLGGGLHHAFAEHAEGFCYVNDVAVAARLLLEEERVGKIAVIDCDVHQGNGTARIFEDDPSVFTFSIHQENNYPLKERSDRDVGLENGVGDAEYLAILAREVPAIFDGERPDFVFYLAGADPFEQDQLGGLSLTKAGLRERDRAVIAWCRERAIPVATVLAGGYAVRLADTITIHEATAE